MLNGLLSYLLNLSNQAKNEYITSLHFHMKDYVSQTFPFLLLNLRKHLAFLINSEVTAVRYFNCPTTSILLLISS